jgi:hypothetical protein
MTGDEPLSLNFEFGEQNTPRDKEQQQQLDVEGRKVKSREWSPPTAW